MSLESWRLNPEQIYNRTFIHEGELNESEDQLSYSLIEKVKSYTKHTFDEFGTVFDAEKRRHDEEELSSIQKKHNGKSADRSQLVTNILLYLIGNKGYLESNRPDRETYIDVAHRYDDVINGTDVIVTFHDENDPDNPILLAIDTTSAEDISKKEDRIKRELSKGHLRRLEYYFNPATNQAVGRQEAIPIVISLPKAETTKIAKKWSEKKESDVAFGKSSLDLDFKIRTFIVEQLKDSIIFCEAQQPRNSQELQEKLQRAIELVQPYPES